MSIVGLESTSCALVLPSLSLSIGKAVGMAAIGNAFRNTLLAPLARNVAKGAQATEAWAAKGPALSADIEALKKATEGGMVVGDLKHLALRGAELYGWFCIGEMVGRGNIYGYFL